MLQKLIGFVAPHDCAVCAQPGEVVCVECARSAFVRKVPSCFYCNRLTLDGRACPVCVRKTSLRGANVLWRYDGHVKPLVYRLKYANDRAVAGFMAAQLTGHFDLSGYDVVTAVPSDGRALRQRGYNQAEILARSVAKGTSLPYRATLLRTAHASQTQLRRSQRLEAVKGNFVCYNPRDVVSQRVLIVDDVMTTGATMNECARMLKAAGAKQVWGLVVAKK
jgi:competence protein ComFC